MHLGYIELEKSALVWSEILRLFVNTLTADNKYSRSNVPISRNKFKRHYLKNKELFLAFYCISEICMKFGTFWKKRRVS